MSRACSFGPHQTTSKSAESKEFKDPPKVESLLTDPWPNVFFSAVSPPPRCFSDLFSQFLWGSPDQNGTFSPYGPSHSKNWNIPGPYGLPSKVNVVSLELPTHNWIAGPNDIAKASVSSEKTIASQFGCLIGILVIVNYMLIRIHNLTV